MPDMACEGCCFQVALSFQITKPHPWGWWNWSWKWTGCCKTGYFHGEKMLKGVFTESTFFPFALISKVGGYIYSPWCFHWETRELEPVFQYFGSFLCISVWRILHSGLLVQVTTIQWLQTAKTSTIHARPIATKLILILCATLLALAVHMYACTRIHSCKVLEWLHMAKCENFYKSFHCYTVYLNALC